MQWDTPDETGETRRDFNARFSWEAAPEVTLSTEAEYLAEIFNRLSSLRTSGINGPDPIQPGTIMDWQLLTGYRLSCDEVEIILKADTVYRRAYALEQERQNEAAKLRQADNTGN